MKSLSLTTILWLASIGSCAAGSGFEAANSPGLGTGFISLGTGLFLYLVFIRDE